MKTKVRKQLPRHAPKGSVHKDRTKYRRKSKRELDMVVEYQRDTGRSELAILGVC